MSPFHRSLTAEERTEIYDDACEAYQSGVTTESEFRKTIYELGYNATDTEDLVKFYRPLPENDNGESD